MGSALLPFPHSLSLHPPPSPIAKPKIPNSEEPERATTVHAGPPRDPLTTRNKVGEGEGGGDGGVPGELYGHMHMDGVYIASDAINTNGEFFFFFSVYLGPLRPIVGALTYGMPAWAASHHTVIIILSQYTST
jgi:hypothetical protein